MSEASCRWGILSTAVIARKNWHAILNSGNGRVVAVASRDSSKAAAFIEECQAQHPFPQAPTALGSYEELIDRQDIDAVYIPLPTGLRKEWVIRAAEAGKHVLCEKPCAVSADDLREMIDACDRNGVQFMDGVMFMHSTRLDAIRDEIDSGSVGDLRRITAQFSFHAPPEFFRGGNIRSAGALEPQGCLGDLGWYCIRFTLWTLGFTLPESVTAHLISSTGDPASPDSVPTELSAELVFPGGVTAGFYCSFRTQHQQWVDISGTSGHLAVQDFVLPFVGDSLAFHVFNSDFVVDDCEFHMRPGRRSIRVLEYSNNHPTAQETNMVRHLAALVNEQRREGHWPEVSLKTQQVLDACMQSAREGGQSVSL